MKVIAYRIRVDGADIVVKTQQDLRKAIRDVNKALDDTEIGSKRYQKLQKELGRLKETQKRVRQDTRDAGREFIRSADRGKRSYRSLNAELVNLKRQYKELSEADRNSNTGRGLLKQIRGLSKELKGIDKTLGDNFRNVGNYQSALKGVFGKLALGAAALGIATGIREIGAAAKEAFRTFVDFRDQVAILGAVSGATAEELKVLEEEAKRLGESTQFTASQVAELQTNFARAGFDPSQIIAATEATLSLATATGEDLARSSEVVTTTLGGYQLTAQDTERATNAMTAAFNTSRLQLESFFEATKIVAPNAASLGVEIEQVNAVLGALADAGIDGSSAGTALRRIFLEMSKESSKLSGVLGVTVKDAESFNLALERLGEIDVTPELADELVGKRALTALQLLSTQSDKIRGLSAAYGSVTGEIDKLGLTIEDIPEKFQDLANAAETAGKVQDSLAGDTKALASAAEGVQISFVGAFEDIGRTITQFITSALRKVSGFSGAFRKAFDFLVDILRPIVEAFANLGSAIFGGTEKVITFEDVLRTLSSVLTFLSNVLATAVNWMAEFITELRDGINEIPLLKGLFDGLVTGVKDLVSLFLDLPNIFNGVLESVKAFRDNIKNLNWERSISDAFENGYYSAQRLASGMMSAQEAAEGLLGIVKEVNDLPIGVRAPGIPDAAAPIITDVEPDPEGDDTFDGLKESATAAEGSIKFLKDRISSLKNELEDLNDDNNIADKLEEIIDAEADLEKAQKRIESIKEDLKFADGQTIDLLVDVIDFDSSAVDREIDRITDESFKAVEEAIQREGIKRVEAARKAIESDKEFQAARKKIEEETQRELLEARLRAAEEGSLAQAKLIQELADLETDINREKNEAILKQEEEAATQRKALLEEVLNESFSIISDVSQLIFSIDAERIENTKNAQIAAINEQEEARLQEYANNEEAQNEIRAEAEEERQKIEAEAAKKQQALAVKQAIINAALAVTKIFATLPPPANFIQAGIVAVKMALEIAKIKNTTFATGGFTGYGSGAPDETGERPVGIVHEGEYVIPKRVLRTRQGMELARAAEILRAQKLGSRFRRSMKFAEGGFTTSPIPATAGGGIIQAEVVSRISEDDIQAIADSVRAGAQAGTRAGSAQGAGELERRRVRLNNLEEKIKV